MQSHTPGLSAHHISRHFPVQVEVIQKIFGIQMCQDKIQVKFEDGCGPIIFGKVIVPKIRNLFQNNGCQLGHSCHTNTSNIKNSYVSLDLVIFKHFLTISFSCLKLI